MPAVTAASFITEGKLFSKYATVTEDGLTTIHHTTILSSTLKNKELDHSKIPAEELTLQLLKKEKGT